MRAYTTASVHRTCHKESDQSHWGVVIPVKEVLTDDTGFTSGMHEAQLCFCIMRMVCTVLAKSKVCSGFHHCLLNTFCQHTSIQRVVIPFAGLLSQHDMLHVTCMCL